MKFQRRVLFVFCFVFVELFFCIAPNTSLAQDTTLNENHLKHQMDFGGFISKGHYVNAFTIGYRHYLKWKWYYTLGGYIEWEHTDNESYTRNRIGTVPYMGFGISDAFLKYFRGYVSLNIFGYYFREFGSETRQGEKVEWDEKEYGVFMGPEFTLEIVPIKKRNFELSIFARMHYGYGYMHKVDTYFSQYEWPKFSFKSYNEWNTLGAIPFGISFRF